jgi:CHAT domain-containing protein
MALGNCAKVVEILERSDGAWVRSFGSALLGFGDNLFATIELPNAYIRHRCLLETGRLPEARAGFDKLLETPQVAQFGEIYWLTLFDRGRIAQAEGDPRAALDFFRKAIETIERQRASINSEASKIGFVGDKQAVYERVVSLLVDAGDAAAAFEYVERSKARALVDMLATRQEFATPGLDAEQGRLILARLDEADRASRSPQIAQGAVDGVRTLQVARQDVQAAAPELSSLVTVTSVPAAELQRLLTEGEALVEYYYAGKQLYAFVATREKLQVVRLEMGGLVEDIERLRREIESLGTDWEKPARQLHARLWAPLEAATRGKSVTVVPHGALHYLPFSTLVAADGSLLIERQALRLLPSASVLKYLKPKVAGTKGLLLALGNPDLDDPKMDLKFAEAEALAVAQMFPESRLLLRREASKSNFMKAGSLFSRIHFASHGKFVASDPLSSGLLLAKGDAAEGMLTVGELYSMNLAADLVTLSACETGLGSIGNGDDVVGLTRGFLYAGARSIVASLWSVDDRATGLLMRAFYANLATLPKDRALIAAQVELRREFAHPFFWAAFHLTGRAD